MADIALFHSVLGVRDGVRAAADVLRDSGHAVTVVDQYGGRVFDDYAEAIAEFPVARVPELLTSAMAAVEGMSPDLVVAGFSNGGGMSEWIATHRPVRAAVLLSGVLPLTRFGRVEEGLRWPAGVPVQSHYTREDPFLAAGEVEAFAAEVAESGGTLEHHWYEGAGHLFTDASLPAEYDPLASDLLWERVTEFLGRLEDST